MLDTCRPGAGVTVLAPAVKLQGQLDRQRGAAPAHYVKPRHARSQRVHQLQAVLDRELARLRFAQPRVTVEMYTHFAQVPDLLL
jgi:hypothetical protein